MVLLLERDQKCIITETLTKNMQLTTAAKTYFTRKLHIGYHQQMVTA